jgi:hypothetical protein
VDPTFSLPGSLTGDLVIDENAIHEFPAHDVPDHDSSFSSRSFFIREISAGTPA